MSKYVVWDRQTPVRTPIGECLTPEEWIARRPIAGQVQTVLSGGLVNGALFAIYNDFVAEFERRGCNFSDCETEQDYLNAIEAFEVATEAEEKEKANSEALVQQRIAAALEAQVLLSLPDDEEEVSE